MDWLNQIKKRIKMNELPLVLFPSSCGFRSERLRQFTASPAVQYLPVTQTDSKIMPRLPTLYYLTVQNAVLAILKCL
jgi:hypothetical protein